MVWCSKCNVAIPTAIVCNALGSSHIKLGLSAYLINDPYVSNKNAYSEEETFQVFCKNCYAQGYYHQRLLEKYPQVIDEHAKARLNKLKASHKSEMQAEKLKMKAVEEQINSFKLQLQQNAGVEGIYRRFQHLYKDSKDKMKSLQSFKSFGSKIINTDAEFKKKIEELHAKIELQYINTSIIRIQAFFSSYIKQIDKKIANCSVDIDRLKELKEATMQRCSESNSFANTMLMNSGRIKSMQSLFDNEIKSYQNSMKRLESFKCEGIVELREEELLLPKMDRSVFVSDAEMHETQEWRFNFFERSTL